MPMPTDDSSMRHMDHASYLRITSALEKSVEFREAKRMLSLAAILAAAAIMFGFSGILVLGHESIDLRAQLRQAADDTKAKLETVVTTAKLETEIRQKTLIQQEKAVETQQSSLLGAISE